MSAPTVSIGGCSGREKSACLDFLIARDLIIFQVAPGL
jgi:hypothetical protein